MIADCLNYDLKFTRGVEDIGVLVTSNDDGSVNELRSVNGPNDGRIYDAEVVDTLVENFGDGVSGHCSCRASSANRWLSPKKTRPSTRAIATGSCFSPTKETA